MYFFFVFGNFFSKNQFFDIFSSFNFKDFETGGSQKNHSYPMEPDFNAK